MIFYLGFPYMFDRTGLDIAQGKKKVENKFFNSDISIFSVRRLHCLNRVYTEIYMF